MNLYSEEFLEWANENEEDFIILFENHMEELWDGEPDAFLRWANNNEEEFNDFFEDYLVAIIEELEQDDYFGTEGFNKRFA